MTRSPKTRELTTGRKVIMIRSLTARKLTTKRKVMLTILAARGLVLFISHTWMTTILATPTIHSSSMNYPKLSHTGTAPKSSATC
jgi:hypothetical protein